jgi:ATP-dependent protease ClpP protease subunit
MEPAKLEKCKSTLLKTRDQIKKLEESTAPRVVLFVTTGSIDDKTAYLMHKFLRKSSDGEINLIVESGGGDIDATAKIVKMIRSRVKGFRVTVPYYAKSAATLLAVSADEIHMCKSAELGPVDPQVRDPVTGIWVPAHSIREAMNFIEQIKDPLVKLSMAEKMPPLLIGAFQDARNAAKEYLEEAFDRLGEKKGEAVKLFLEKHTSHGYPIDREVCKSVGLNVVYPPENIESMICELHEEYSDFLYDLQKSQTKEEDNGHELDVTIIQEVNSKTILINGEDVSQLV